MSEVISTTNRRTITVSDVEKMAARGSSMSGLLADLESERILSFVNRKNIIRPTHNRKWNGFEDVRSLLKEVGIPDDQIVRNPVALWEIRYYYNGERNKKDYIVFQSRKRRTTNPNRLFPKKIFRDLLWISLWSVQER